MVSHRFRSGRKEEGQGLVEYSFILLFVAIAVVLVMVFLGQNVKAIYCKAMVGLAPMTEAPDMCLGTFVTLKANDQGPDFLNLEAVIDDPEADPDDPYERIIKVEFYIDDTDGSPVQTEYHYRYCLSGNPHGTPCGNYNTGGLPPGKHKIIALAYFEGGEVGQSTFIYKKK